MADADVALFTDEYEQHAEHQQCHHHQRHRGQQRARDIAIEQRHGPRRARRARSSPGPSIAARLMAKNTPCTHHSPSAELITPCSSQVRAASARFAYTANTSTATQTCA